MDAMPRPRPPYLIRERNRHGTVVWYVRKGTGPRTRIKGDYGSPEFIAAYQAAVSGNARTASKRAASGSLAWLLERYRDSGDWSKLSGATRRQRDNIFRHVIAAAGDVPASDLEQADIVASVDKRRNTPSQARNYLDAMKGLYRWAKKAGMVPHDPTLGVEPPPKPKGPGFAMWSEDEVDAYEARWPLGTKERVWMAVLLYTGLRRGDAVRLGRQHVSDGVATLRTEKTDTEVSIPILPVLAEALKAGPCGDLAFICGVNRKPLTKESFGNLFKLACREAGVNKSAHGLRKLGATRAANAGATVAELEAIFGWTGGNMASHYTKEADRRRLAKGAMEKLRKAGT
jgi:integrase